MLIAVDKDKNRIHIDDTEKGHDYFCPSCGEKLILKKGDIMSHHFAHPAHSECVDDWHHDMSIWHQNWQNCFPLETQEIIKEKDGKVHRADVLLEDKKVVFEFQHSPMSNSEFRDRNNFYNSLGYKVIWVFDVSEQYDNRNIDISYKNLVTWFRPKKTFDGFVPNENKNVVLFLQLSNDPKNDDTMVELQRKIDNGIQIHSLYEDYYESHKGNVNRLIKVSKTLQYGLGNFYIDGFYYDEKYLVDKYVRENIKKEEMVPLSYLYDELIELVSKRHTTYFFGCPRSRTHISGDYNTDMADGEYEKIYPCSECEFLVDNQLFRCNKRFMDTGLPSDLDVKITSRNEDGFIKELMYFDGEKEKRIELPVYKNTYGKSVYALWDEHNCSIAVFRNIKTRTYVKIFKDPQYQKHIYGEVYGRTSVDGCSFSDVAIELHDLEKPEWFFVWGGKNNIR